MKTRSIIYPLFKTGGILTEVYKKRKEKDYDYVIPAINFPKQI